MKIYRASVISLYLSVALMAVSPTLLAKEQSEPEKDDYRLVYAKDSPMKDLSLNNIEFKAHFYSNGMPKGYHEYKTNEQGEFEIAHPLHAHHHPIAMKLVQLQDDVKNHESCKGNLIYHKKELRVTCHKKQRAHKKQAN